MKLITYITAALIFVSTPAFTAGADQEPAGEIKAFITLASEVTVDDGVVRLGDIFHGAGKYEDRVVAYAPRPGSRAVFDARWLMRVAAAYKLDWRPSSATDRVIIDRASQVVTKNDIEDLLQQRHIEEGGEPSSRTILSNRDLRLHLPTSAANGIIPMLSVEQMTVEPGTGRFSAVVAWGNGADDRMRLAGRVERMTQVPVLSGRVMRGEIIDEANIVWQSLPETRLPRTTITDMDMIVGMSAKRALAPGAPIAAADVRRPLLVNRGETVTMMLTTPTMQLTAKGRALQNGSIGDIVRISNLQTNTVVDAVVTGPGQARVDTAVNLAMR
jgi:flagella basal body P-ring formation protein FlgA